MFRPNLKCNIARLEGATITGKRVYGAWRNVPVAIVKLEEGANKTSVRTDSSASRGSAQEILSDARLMFPAFVILRPGDRVSIFGFELTVVSVRPRHAVTGRFDHWQVDCNIYGA